MFTKRQLALAVALACSGQIASASIDVDGKFDGIELGKYSTIVGFTVQPFTKAKKDETATPIGGPIPGGFLALGMDKDTEKQYLFFKLPTDFVDNSFGTGSVGYPKTHTFEKLEKSDRAQFTFFPTVGESKTVEIDYISKTGDEGKNTDYTSAGLDKDGKGDFGPLGEVATSLEYNLSLDKYKDSDFLTNSPTPGDVKSLDWLFATGYELEFDKNTFSSDVFMYQSVLEGHYKGNTVYDGKGKEVLTLHQGHASPSKFGTGGQLIGMCDYASLTCGQGETLSKTLSVQNSQVPEPGTVSLLGAALAFLGIKRRRRRLATTT